MAEALFTIEIDNKVYQMTENESYEIEDCDEGKVVIINLINGNSYTGIFHGMDGDIVLLKSIKSSSVVGLEIDWIKSYLEEI